MELKKLMAGEIRFIIKKVGSAFRVYDRARGSYPYSHPALGGGVRQDIPQKEAQEEADRLNKEFGSAPVAGSSKQKRGSKQKKEASETVEAPAPEEEVELPDYGEVLSEEEAAKYAEGIFEETKY